MRKKILVLMIIGASSWAALGQKQKATFNHEVFAKKTIPYMNLDISAMCGKEPDFQFIATATGKSIEDVRSQNEENIKKLKEDIDFLNKNGIFRIFDKAELTIIEETPIKRANIIVYCHYKDKNYTLTFTNCIQTNTTWIMGDGIDPKGDAIADLIKSKRERDERASNSFVAKLAAKGEEMEAARKAQLKIDSANRIAAEAAKRSIRGYRAVLFPMQGTDEVTQYIHKELINQSLPGYYIDVKGNKVDAKDIRYWEPYTLLMTGPTFGDAMAAAPIPAKDIAAFYVGDQLFVQYLPGKWGVLISEGAIRKLVTFSKAKVKIKGEDVEIYSVNNLIQKLNESPENYVSLSLQFAMKMSEYTRENLELADKIKNKTIGYGQGDRDKIIDEYNKSYDKQFPGKVKYLPLGLPEPSEFITINSKEELKNYLSQKLWEPVSVTPYDGNMARETLVGVDKIRQGGQYRNYQMFSNGTLLQGGQYTGKWDVKDKQTVVMTESREIFGIRFITNDQFEADTRGYAQGLRESTIVLKATRALTDKEWNQYDSTTNSMARTLPPQFKALVNSWKFDKMMKGPVNATAQFPLGTINGNPISIDFQPDGYLLLQNGVRKANGIDMAQWVFVNGASHNLELRYYYDSTKKVKQATEKYNLVSVTDTDLVYEDKTTSTKFYWKKAN